MNPSPGMDRRSGSWRRRFLPRFGGSGKKSGLPCPGSIWCWRRKKRAITLIGAMAPRFHPTSRKSVVCRVTFPLIAAVNGASRILLIGPRGLFREPLSGGIHRCRVAKAFSLRPLALWYRRSGYSSRSTLCNIVSDGNNYKVRGPLVKECSSPTQEASRDGWQISAPPCVR